MSALEDAVLLALVQDWMRTSGTEKFQVWIEDAVKPRVSTSRMPAALRRALQAWCLERIAHTYEFEPQLGPDWRADGDDPWVRTTWYFRPDSPPLWAGTFRVQHLPRPYTGP